MLKYLLILGILIYVVYKVGSFFYRAGQAAQQLRNFQQRQANENAHASTAQSKNKKDEKFKGGEYIDYEEVK